MLYTYFVTKTHNFANKLHFNVTTAIQADSKIRGNSKKYFYHTAEFLFNEFDGPLKIFVVYKLREKKKMTSIFTRIYSILSYEMFAENT